MCVKPRTMHFLTCLIVAASLCDSAPSSEKNATPGDGENSLDHLLSTYYDEYVDRRAARARPHQPEPEDDIYETMQGDQPSIGNSIGDNSGPSETNSSGFASLRSNFTDQYLEAARNRRRRTILNPRSKENFINFLKNNILEHLGRGNSSMPKPDVRLSSINMSQIMPKLMNVTNMFDEDHITEKIRSFYPSCDVPSNTDQELWKDDDIMNLFFNFDYVPTERNTNIATATLRLYRLPENGTEGDPKDSDCNNFNSTEDEKLLRVSIYWYTKSLKKRRDKRRLSDSKVIPEQSKWVELSVKPATKAWSRGKNLGLGVLVEDQEGNTLRADRYFKGASCMVGTSTPKPIPTIIIDAARQTNELNRIDGLHRRNSTAQSAVYSDVQLLPTIDICTLEFPANYTQPAHIANLRVNACNLKKMHEQSLKLVEKERLERLAALPELMMPSSRHIRHQRQYLANKKNEEGREDPRSRIVGSTVLFTNEEWQNYTNNKFNFSTVNR